jgi:hypothetical protein
MTQILEAAERRCIVVNYNLDATLRVLVTKGSFSGPHFMGSTSVTQRRSET